jgi:hypothetical protein
VDGYALRRVRASRVDCSSPKGDSVLNSLGHPRDVTKQLLIRHHSTVCSVSLIVTSSCFTIDHESSKVYSFPSQDGVDNTSTFSTPDKREPVRPIFLEVATYFRSHEDMMLRCSYKAIIDSTSTKYIAEIDTRVKGFENDSEHYKRSGHGGVKLFQSPHCPTSM